MSRQQKAAIIASCIIATCVSVLCTVLSMFCGWPGAFLALMLMVATARSIWIEIRRAWEREL